MDNKLEGELFEKYQRIISKVLEDYNFSKENKKYLKSWGIEGLLLAIRRRKKNKGDFVSYAFSYVKGYIKKGLKKEVLYWKNERLFPIEYFDKEISKEDLEEKSDLLLRKRKILKVIERKYGKDYSYIVDKRWGLSGSGRHSLNEVGKRLNISSRNVSKKEMRALKFLKEYFSNGNIRK